MFAQPDTLAANTYTPDAAHALGQIAVKLPGATAVFRRLKLDFCCGGQISLSQAAAAKGLDAQAVLAQLQALRRDASQPVASDPPALIEHILTRYHAVHRDQLPELIRMADRVEAVHRNHPLVPTGLADLLETMEQELLAHMEKEEAILFPMLLDGGNPFVSDPIDMMRAEHLDHGALLDQLAVLTHDATAPEDACTTWRALYGGVNQLTNDLMNHIHLENNLLFAQFDAPANGQPERSL